MSSQAALSSLYLSTGSIQEALTLQNGLLFGWALLVTLNLYALVSLHRMIRQCQVCRAHHVHAMDELRGVMDHLRKVPKSCKCRPAPVGDATPPSTVGCGSQCSDDDRDDETLYTLQIQDSSGRVVKTLPFREREYCEALLGGKE